jgi:hypothetical protein
MPALLGLYPCPSCGRNHNFYEPGATTFSPWAVYVFTCPTTDEAAMLEHVAPDRGLDVTECPNSAVTLKRHNMPP